MSAISRRESTKLPGLQKMYIKKKGTEPEDVTGLLEVVYLK